MENSEKLYCFGKITLPKAIGKGEKMEEKERWLKELGTFCPKILIAPSALVDLKLYVALFHLEISGIGEVKRREGNLIVSEIILLPQEAASSGTATILDAEAQAIFLEQLELSGKDSSDYNLWWHSHPHSKVLAWSPTDETAIAKEGVMGLDFHLSILLNKFGNIRTRIDVFRPLRITLDHLLIELTENVEPKKFQSMCKARKSFIEQKIKENVRIIKL